MKARANREHECKLCKSCKFYERCRIMSSLVMCRQRKCKPLCFSCKFYDEK